ncbi:hypothetical protein ABZ726_33020, partial [Streptomyces hundungensis]|uniref:hypothetical protein n=1 Tax=Streptomyces hundungensis TaxID=1077946 RepID=UPI003404E83B
TGYAWRYRRNVALSLGSSLAGMAVMALVPLIRQPGLHAPGVLADRARAEAAPSDPPGAGKSALARPTVPANLRPRHGCCIGNPRQ